MEEGRPSFTAMETAMLRAAHLIWDAPPKRVRYFGSRWASASRF
jgi:hypothetical protein